MTRLFHEIGMLLAICLLEVWRFTGVPLHEWLAAIVAIAVLVHLLMQREWFGARVINALLFIAFTLATMSGLAMSKVIFPRHAPVADYMQWHEIHDVSSKLVMLLVGLHVAMNWTALRRLRTVRFRLGAKYAAASLLAIVLLSGAAVAIKQLAPRNASVDFYTPDGKVHKIPPPQELAELRGDARRPNPGGGAPKLAVTALLIAGIAVAGRKVLKFRG